MTPTEHNERLAHIEVLRGTSVLLVLLYHLQIPGFSFAYLGVDAFFVISGFLMALLYGGMSVKADVLDFYRRRLSRLLPAYYAVLILTVPVAALRVLPHEYSDVVRYANWSALLAPNIGFWLDASYFEAQQFRPILNFWSLGVELQFYLFFPLIAIASRRFPKSVLLLAVASFLLYLLVYSVSPKTAFFQTPCRIWQFMIGFYVARHALKLPSGAGEAALLGVVGLILAAPWLGLPASALSTAVAVLAGLFIAGGLVAPVAGSAPGRALVVLGKYSYSIYLVHFPVIAFLGYTPFSGTNLILTAPGVVAALALTAILSVLLYHLVETPLRRRRTGKFIAWTAAVGAIVVAGTATAAMPFNQALLPPRQQLVTSAWFDRLPYRCPKLDRLIHPARASCLIAGEGGPGVLLVGDSHTDLLKGVLGEEVAKAGGHLRLMVTNEALGPALTPAQVMAEATATGTRLIVVHAFAGHFDVSAIASLAPLAAGKGIALAVIAPMPQPGFHVPQRLYSLLQAGQTLEPTMTLQEHRRTEAKLLSGLAALPGQAPNVRLFEPDGLLCTPLCALQDAQGHPFYSDHGHLSQTGVKRIRPLLRDVAAMAGPAALPRPRRPAERLARLFTLPAGPSRA